MKGEVGREMMRRGGEKGGGGKYSEDEMEQ